MVIFWVRIVGLQVNCVHLRFVEERLTKRAGSQVQQSIQRAPKGRKGSQAKMTSLALFVFTRLVLF